MWRVAGLSLILLISTACMTTAPVSPTPEDPSFHRADDVRRLSCYEGTDFSSRIAVSERLAAPNGSSYAWSEVRAIASMPGDETTRSCRNISRLWLASDGGEPRLIFEQNPGAEGRNGNSIVPIAWSEDGAQLLFELETWTYYTDRDPPILAVWNAQNSEVSQVSISPAMAARRGDCGFALRAHRFDADGRVLVTTAPLPESDSRGLPPCSPAVEHWAVALDGSIEEHQP